MVKKVNLNGSGNAATVEKKEQPKAPLVPVKAAAPIPPVPFEPAPKNQGAAIPLEDRLHKLNRLYELQTKYNTLCQSREKLSAFKMKKNPDEVYLSMGNGNSNYSNNDAFKTGNAEIIGEVVDFLKAVIDKKIAALEPLLNW